ncbi:MAG: S8 family serine peptidase [Bdellovibrionales bacterium]|nr:S8 family serine peptidase [Oligoflexia bacterium]
MKHTIILLGFAFLIMGCQKSSGNDAVRIPAVEEGQQKQIFYSLHRTSSVSTPSNPFQLLKEACTKSSGKYLDPQHICDCGTGKVLLKNGFTYRCDYNASKENIISAYPDFEPSAYSAPGLTSSDVPAELFFRNKQGFLSQADAKSFIHTFIEYPMSVVKLEGSASSDAMGFIVPKLNGYDLFTTKVQLPSLKQDSAPPLSKIVLLALSLQQEKPLRTELASGSDLSCLEYCNSLEYYPDLATGEKILHSRVFYLGGLLRNQIIISTSDDNLIALLSLTPAGNLNAVITKQNVTTDSARLQEINVYDSSLSLLTKRPVVTTLASTPLLESINKLRRASAKDAAAVICESNMAALAVAKPSFNLLRGPAEKSDMGWLDDSHHAADGVEMANDKTGLALQSNNSSDYYTLSSHAAAVADAFENQGPSIIPIIPVSANACLNAFDSWSSNVLGSSNARTINFSAFLPVSEQACNTTFIAKNIEKSKDSFLWIVAAGNEGMDLDSGAPFQCPQVLNNRPNLIKVAAGIDNGLERYSNYGYLSVDLAAPGRIESGPQGTSFAAPRVSKVAARIHALNQDLSPDFIRKALLFSVSFNDLKILPVRSGGLLNEEEAIEFAKFGISNKPRSDLEWVRGYYCNEPGKTCTAIKSRVLHWKKTLLLGE